MERSHAFSDWLRHHAILTSFIILLCTLSTRLFLTVRADPNDLTFSDSPTYLIPAQNLLKGGSFLNRYDEPEIYRTPGFPVFLAALMYVVGEDLRDLLIAQTIVLCFSVLILYWLARRILPPLMAFTGTLLAAFSPWSAARAGFLLSEGFYLMILVSLFFVMHLVVERTATLSAVAFGGGIVGLLTSAAVFVRPIWPLIPIVAITSFMLCKDKRNQAWIFVTVMLLVASAPLYLWIYRNVRVAQFEGLSMTAVTTAHQYFASSVKARIKEADGDRWAFREASETEEFQWDLSSFPQALHDKRLQRVRALIKEHPFLSLYAFALNTSEAILHPDPAILTPSRLNFYRDIWVLGGLWAALLILALIGLCCSPDQDRDGGILQRNWLMALTGICLLLTIPAGLSFGGGSRFRISLELIIPLLAGVGLVRLISRIISAKCSCNSST